MTATENPDPSERTFDERFASLEDSNRALAANVLALTQSLRVLSDIQTQIRDQKQRQDEADKALVLAKDEADARDARTRQVTKVGGFSLAIVLSLVAILVYGALINHVSDLLADQRAQFYKSCLTRNAATMSNVVRELALAAADKDKDVKAIHERSARELSSPQSQPDCNRYRK